MKENSFITFEGIDGSGKSTQLKFVSEYLKERNIKHLCTREPGGTKIGESLRKIILNQNVSMTAETQTVLMFAARKEHLDSVILVYYYK